MIKPSLSRWLSLVLFALPGCGKAALASSASYLQQETRTREHKQSQGQAPCTLPWGEVRCPRAGQEQTGTPCHFQQLVFESRQAGFLLPSQAAEGMS